MRFLAIPESALVTGDEAPPEEAPSQAADPATPGAEAPTHQHSARWWRQLVRWWSGDPD